MQKLLIIAGLFFCSFLTRAQAIFRTVVPQQPVSVGDPFQVQYIIEGEEKVKDFKAPIFNNFRFVAGPSIYHGSASSFSGGRQLENTVYTIEAIRPGRFFIPGATASVNGSIIKSNSAVVQVISREEALRRSKMERANSDYFLRPGESAEEKIKQNLFLKVSVDKRKCYVGEPILATFKLYSRLESKSDIVKNPGFYGFTVYDMINLSDRFVTTEELNGKIFDVHTIRKVQLYPLQAGSFTIDPMELKNKVEFSRSAVYKKTEQEIVEGVLNQGKEPTENKYTQVFETAMHTEPVNIIAQPFPLANKPDSFNGAVGNFTISTNLATKELARNEEGSFDLTIKGSGNFIQLNAPSIIWPEGIEGFDPGFKDSLNKTTSPTMGSRTFHYSFLSAKPGRYFIPALEFSFFNPDSGKYKIIKTEGQYVTVSTAMLPEKYQPGTITKRENKPGEKYWLVALLAFTGFIAVLSLYFIYKKRKTTTLVNKDAEIKPIVISVEELLAPAAMNIHADEKSFYSSLHQAVWTFLGTKLHLSGSGVNKENLVTAMQESHIKQEYIHDVQEILLQCEAGRFTHAIFTEDKTILLQKTRILLKELETVLF